jgi:hypothetical protein
MPPLYTQLSYLGAPDHGPHTCQAELIFLLFTSSALSSDLGTSCKELSSGGSLCVLHLFKDLSEVTARSGGGGITYAVKGGNLPQKASFECHHAVIRIRIRRRYCSLTWIYAQIHARIFWRPHPCGLCLEICVFYFYRGFAKQMNMWELWEPDFRWIH